MEPLFSAKRKLSAASLKPVVKAPATVNSEECTDFNMISKENTLPKDFLQKLQSDTEFADLSITCGGQTWLVHKAILCAQSKWIRAALLGRRFPEGQKSVIDLRCNASGTNCNLADYDDPSIIKIIIDCCYGRPIPTDTVVTPLLHLAKLWVTMDKYQIDDHKSAVLEQFKAFLADNSERSPKRMRTGLAPRENKVIPQLDKVLRFLYQNSASPRCPLKKATVMYIVRNHEYLLWNESIKSALADHIDLMKDVYEALRDEKCCRFL